jgi:hypothetical protein
MHYSNEDIVELNGLTFKKQDQEGSFTRNVTLPKKLNTDEQMEIFRDFDYMRTDENIPVLWAALDHILQKENK